MYLIEIKVGTMYGRYNFKWKNCLILAAIFYVTISMSSIIVESGLRQKI
jgi:hypothetical protein